MATYRNSDEALMERVRRYIKGLGLYAKPADGIPASDLAKWVLPSAVTDYSVGGLGYTKNLGTVTEVEFCPSNNNTVVFGSRSSATSRNFSVMCGADAIYADFGNYNSTRCTLNTTISDGHWYKVTMDKSKRRIEDLDTGVYAEQTTVYPTSFTTPNQLRIAGKGSNFPSSYTGFKGKIRSVKFYESGTLVRDFIPVRVGTTGYLWDKVTEELYGNSGSGSFVLGPDVV